MALYEGQLVGPYQVIGPLGQGGMATVYKAYHARLDRYVAIKVMHKAFSEEADFLARFEREAQIVAKLEHPHIVPVYDYNEHEGQPYLVMKFIEGWTLKRVLAENTLSLEQIISIMDDIAGALTYAHQHGVIHRDIKPSNVVIGDDGMVYLTDFGLARIAQSGASTMSQDMILGTPQYISPEQANGQKDLTPRTDVYSFGVILYEMVVGRVPFNADTPYAIVHDHIYTDLPRPGTINPMIPASVEAVLIKALAKNPSERYSSATEVMEAFQAAAAEANLIALDPNRKTTAEQSFARRAVRPMEDAPTISADMVQSPAIPAPIPPLPPLPSPPGKKSKKGAKQVVIERPIPGGNVRASFDMGELGKKLEDGVRGVAKWGERMAATIEEAAKEGARSAAAQRAAANSPEAEEARIRKKIEKRYKERQGFLIHLMIYVVMNIIFWGMWASAGSQLVALIPDLAQDAPAIAREAANFPWPIFITFFWGIGLVSHFLSYYYKYGGGAERREVTIQREIERYKERTGAYEKPKNERRPRLELTDDGEIQEVYDDEVSRVQKQKRR